MFDLQAAEQAARDVLAQAPLVGKGETAGFAVPVADLVAAIVRAGHPEALIPPPYDPELAPDARYRVAMPEGEDGQGAMMWPLVEGATVALRLQLPGRQPAALGRTYPSAAHQLGLALCAAAQAAAAASIPAQTGREDQ